MENPPGTRKLPAILRRAKLRRKVTEHEEDRDGQQQIEHSMTTNEKVNFVPFKGAILPMSTMFIIKAEDTSSINPAVPSSCVVCHRRCPADLIIQNKISLKTEADLQVLLGDILGFASKSLKEYKEQFGALQKWIPLCSQCLDVIKEGRQIQEQISQLQKHLKARKDLILEKVMDIYYCQGKNHSENLEKARKLIDLFLKAYQNSNSLLQASSALPITSQSEEEMKKEDENDEETETGEDEAISDSENEDSDSNDCKKDEDYIDVNDLSSGKEDTEDEVVDPLEESKDDNDDDEKEKEEEIVHLNRDKKEQRFIFRDKGFRYACPNCPQIKSYTVTRYALHLAIHRRRPFRCSECFEFLPNQEDLREQHWKDKHGDKMPTSGEDKFIEIKFDPGKIYHCDGCWGKFSATEERDRHEKKCKMFKKKRKKYLCKRKEETRKCVTCEESFRHRDEWRLHRNLVHPEVDSLSCFNCDKSFAEKTADSGLLVRNEFKMKDHLKADHEGRERADGRIVYDECELCGMVFGGGGFGIFEGKVSHVSKAHGLPASEAYSCKICRKTFKRCYLVRQHVLNVHFPPYSTNITTASAPPFPPPKVTTPTNKNKRQKFNDNLSASAADGGGFICDICGTKIKHAYYFRHHKYSKHGILPEGAEAHSCAYPECKFKSPSKSVVAIHKRTHEKDKKIKIKRKREFQCQLCGVEGIKSAAHYYKHKILCRGVVAGVAEALNKDPNPRTSEGVVQVQTIDKPIQCDICGNCYSNPGNLNFHIKTQHTNKPEVPATPAVHEFDPARPFQCKVCSKGFVNKSRLARHEQIHQNKDSKPFRCDTCLASFAVLENLKTHQRLHCVSGGWRERNFRAKRKRIITRVTSARAAIQSQQQEKSNDDKEVIEK